MEKNLRKKKKKLKQKWLKMAGKMNEKIMAKNKVTNCRERGKNEEKL